MLKRIVLCTGLVMLPTPSPCSEGAALPQAVRLPGTAHEVAVEASALEPGSDRIKPEVLSAVAAWLSSNYDLPPIDEPPAIAFGPSEAIAALRHRDPRPDSRPSSQAAIGGDEAPHASTIVAVYDDATRTIYLPDGWTGGSAVELSVLVHEMVHHLQNLAALTYACPEEREQLAYAAQQDWLALFGRDLFADFGTDPFTLMARTHCAY
jgi:hypothetical protein